MKITIIILILIAWFWFFYDIEKNKSIDDAKKEMWFAKDSDQNLENQPTSNNREETKENISNKSKPSYSVSKLDNRNYIEIDDLSSKVENLTESIKISWKILDENVEKIIVNFKNTSSSYPNDRYILKNFKKWDKTFEYNAESRLYHNLDYGENMYLIEAYIWDEASRVQLTIKIPKDFWENEEKENYIPITDKITYDKKVIWSWDEALYLGMPISNTFWRPLNLWNWEITYSNISGLVIKKDNFIKSEIRDDNVWKPDSSWYLNKNLDSPFIYWNSFRSIDLDNPSYGSSFYVLRKKDDKYIYEKYYFDFRHNLKWVLEIEKFDSLWGSVSVEMSELNWELRNKNKDFEIVKITDSLFREIVR